MAVLQPFTKRQAEIMAFLREHITEKGYAPSLAEICEHFKLSALATVHKHLTHLKEKGHITRRWNHARAIELTVDRCPTCGRPQLESAGV